MIETQSKTHAPDLMGSAAAPGYAACPFCGQDWLMVTFVNEDGGHFVGCQCGAQGPLCSGPMEARAAWDMRKNDSQKIGGSQLLASAKELFKADTYLRLRISQYAGQIKKFSEWNTHTEAMRQMEQALKHNAAAQPTPAETLTDTMP